MLVCMHVPDDDDDDDDDDDVLPSVLFTILIRNVTSKERALLMRFMMLCACY